MTNTIDMQEAIDILAIQRVLYTNFRATDAKDWDLFETTLADEIRIDFVGLQPTATLTRQQLRDQSEPSYAKVETQHMSTNLDIRVDGDTASSTSYGRARHEYSGEDNAIAPDRAFWHIYGRYENSYVRTDAGWQICRIRMEPRWQEGNPQLLADAAATEA